MLPATFFFLKKYFIIQYTDSDLVFICTCTSIYGIQNFWFWKFLCFRLSGLENGLLGLSSRVDAIMWSKTINDIENIDIICFGHLLFEMCAGYELNAPQPTAGHFELDLNRYPQVFIYATHLPTCYIHAFTLC